MITIFSKEDCPYCEMAKNLITSLGQQYIEIDVTNDSEKIIEISKISGFRTVPQIFVGEIVKENCLGGYLDIKKLDNNGELKDILQK